MRVVRNIGWVERRRKTGRIMVFSGLLFLVAAFLLTFSLNQVLLSYIGLIIGFIMFNGGMQQVARWSRKPRTDEVIDHVLSRLNDRYAAIHYPAIPGRRPDHVIVSPAGIVALTTREVGGTITLDGRRWKRSALKQMFNLGGPQLGNPTVENEAQVAALEEYLDSAEIDASVLGVVLFIHPDVEIEMRSPESTIVHIDELYDFIREIGADGTSVGADERNEIISALTVGERIEETASTTRRPRKKVRAA